ncbi:gliding motility-associated C-terminal domain-containing protein [Mucilaginibacter psychrotolerans]|uniref:T9SS type B sorting domain-containing protein n=1 Tax=Mucilaginibacter psychrotolerans TaxID=1524096 RepID=A0A4Y8SHU1_9SPHI|nr:gliding motility-associated C-terminal domain-containing protein [Mucilaginibacter psychrotolerans]TFF37976.1 T9SS type B sorting domain-containing protein [Mucilaginibacter psychrotolerans]
MRPIKLPIFIFLFSVLSILQVHAQVCKGSLGDPVINQDFGSGNGPGAPLGTLVTSYNYTADSCPNDGSYSIGSRTSGCFSGSWHTITKDHTGNANGYMMIINASNNPGQFFQQLTPVGALCQNTTYEFSAWILNLILPSSCNGQSSRPNITFIIETPDGVVLPTSDPNTGDILPTNLPDQWIQKRTFFTTPPGVTQVVLKMINNAPGGCGNDLLLDDITFRACGPVVQAGFAGSTSVTTQNVCEKQPAVFDISATPEEGYTSAAFQWQRNFNDGKGWVDTVGATEKSLHIVFPNSQVGDYMYRMGVAESSNISSLNCRVYSNPVTITVSKYPVVPAIPPTEVCEGETLTLTATGGVLYSWTGPNLPATSQNQLVIRNVTAANAGKYQVTVTSAQGCETIRFADVTVKPKPVITVSQTATICRSASTVITANAPGAASYSWAPATGLSDANVASPIASPDATTVYTVTVTGANGCSNTEQVTVKVVDRPTADAGKDKKIFQGQSVKLDGSSTGEVLSYSWSPTDYLDDPNSATPTASPMEDITYTLTVTSLNNCFTAQDEVFVRVYKKVVIPNTFSPNNDGTNDIWNIEALETYAQSTIKIFNKNGQQVYASTGYAKPWNGTLNGKLLPGGTYYYVIDLKNDSPLLSGWVLLVR